MILYIYNGHPLRSCLQICPQFCHLFGAEPTICVSNYQHGPWYREQMPVCFEGIKTTGLPDHLLKYMFHQHR